MGVQRPYAASNHLLPVLMVAAGAITLYSIYLERVPTTVLPVEEEERPGEAGESSQ